VSRDRYCNTVVTPLTCNVYVVDRGRPLPTMAPIPTTFDAEAQALLEAVERRQNDLSTFQIPRLQACTGPLSTQQAWAAEVREDIEQLAKQVEVSHLDSRAMTKVDN